MGGVTVAKIALSAATYAIDRPYDYAVSAELAEVLRPGMRVLVPFGAGNRRTEGLVLALEGDRPPDSRRKPVTAVLDREPVLDCKAIQLALWMRERWFCTVYDAARAMLPAGLYFSLQDRWKIAPGVDRERAYEAAGRSEHARRLLELIFASGGQADVIQIREAFGVKDPNPALKLLRDRGILVLETSAARGVKDRTEQVAALAVPVVQLASAALTATGAAALVLTTEGKWDRRMLPALGAYWLFLLSWLPITLAGFWRRTTVWEEIRHTRNVIPEAMAR